MIICFTEKPGKPVASPGTHRNEFPARYSLAGCSPAAPASASLAVLILQPSAQPVQENPANGKCLNFSLSQKRAQPTILSKTLILEVPEEFDEQRLRAFHA